MSKFNLVPLLSSIDPDESYTTWIQVGMALKLEGYPLSIWEKWSKNGSKYHEGECAKKWNTFGQNDDISVTGATITQMAKDRGWQPQKSKNIAFDAKLTDDDLIVVDSSYIETDEFKEPSRENWRPIDDTIQFLKTLFRPDEIPCIVVDSFQDKDGKYKPKGQGYYFHTCREIIEKLKDRQNFSEAIGSYDIAAGAWVRINPMDGEGAKNSNVTDYRYTLIESDNLPIEKQIALIKELQLPVATLTYSGGKSVHAIVHVDADTQQKYKERVQRMYQICIRNGLTVDTQNKNPSRLSRLAGCWRNAKWKDKASREIESGKKQFLIDTNIGQPDYESWIQWMEDQSDDLPEFVNYYDIKDNLPPLAPELIEGILRQGHKMLITGPSKAGKSFALIELAIAIAEGKKWFGWQCHEGNVLYINLEIDDASCDARVAAVYDALGITPSGRNNLLIWNLRGKVIPMHQLAPVIIRRAKKLNLKAVIIDPIYKVITGDENAAGDIAKFCNEFDKICRELGVSCIYCHHHSKGAQGSKKAQDRGSGSGVFARDPDALIDINPLQVENKGPDDMEAYKVSGILREFPTFKPFGIYFKYPIHLVDESGFLTLAAEEGSLEGNQVKGRITQTTRKSDRREQIIRYIEEKLGAEETVTQKGISEEFEVSILTVRRDLKAINNSAVEPVYLVDELGRISRSR